MARPFSRSYGLVAAFSVSPAPRRNRWVRWGVVPSTKQVSTPLMRTSTVQDFGKMRLFSRPIMGPTRRTSSISIRCILFLIGAAFPTNLRATVFSPGPFSADGRYYVFCTETNLVADDQNDQ